MRYDLHTHSTMSDGVYAPADVVKLAADAGVDGIALSDHDTTAGVEEARRVGESLGVEVLMACELSSELNERPVHMLAYFIDPEHARWADVTYKLRNDRVVRAELMVEKLRALGVDVTFERVREIAQGQSIGRPHVAQALVEAGVVPTVRDAFTPEWIADGGRAHVTKPAPSPTEAVALINEAGGAAVIAHPIWVEREQESAESVIEACVGVGLAGLEVNHPDHDIEWRARFTKIADRFGLIQTASSDFHGTEHGDRIGANTCDETVVEALRERAAKR